jgi:hypothetical protein
MAATKKKRKGPAPRKPKNRAARSLKRTKARTQPKAMADTKRSHRRVFGGAMLNASPYNTANQSPWLEGVLISEWRASRLSPMRSKGGAEETLPVPLESFPLLKPQPDLSETGGPQLAPVSPIPDLSGLTDDEAAEVIKEWFLTNFEDPVQETPRADGEYLFIWGGPYDASDEVYRAFGASASEAAVDAAIRAIEAEDVGDWAPHGNRGLPPDDRDRDETPP